LGEEGFRALGFARSSARVVGLLARLVGWLGSRCVEVWTLDSGVWTLEKEGWLVPEKRGGLEPWTTWSLAGGVRFASLF
jgi:hypothetical protein